MHPDLRISVIIPVYNAAPYLPTAVASALQFPEVREVILVEDASPDNCLEVCHRLAAADPRVVVFQHPDKRNHGAGASRNLGISKASQPFIAFLDADDRFLPHRFAHEHRIFAEHPDADGVYGAIAPYYWDDEGRERFERTFHHPVTTVHQRVPPEQVFAGLTYTIPQFGYFSLIALTLKRSALEKVQPWFVPELRLHQDSEFLIRLAWSTRLYAGSIDEPVSLRGVHRANRITNNQRKHSTRAALYQRLWQWASNAGVDAATMARLHLLYRKHEVLAARSALHAWRIARRQPALLRNYDYREALFTRMANGREGLKKVLHKIGWRLYQNR